MTRLPRSLIGIVVAIGFVAGLYLMSGRSAPRLPEPEAPPAQPPVQATGAERSNDLAEQIRNAELRRHARALERELAALKAQQDAGVATPPPAAAVAEPPPLAWPQDVPEPYTPRAFEAVAHRAAAECGMGLEVVDVDCSEFPCIAWTKATDPKVKAFSMSGCSPWNEAFRNGAAVIGSVGDEDADGGVGLRYFAWMAVPPNPGDLPAAFKRAKWRAQEMKASLGLQ